VAVAPLTPDELQSVAQTRAANLIADDQTPLTGELGLHEAMARAIKYNLDHQIEIANIQFSQATQSLTNMDMLPDLVLSGEYSDRTNQPGGSSVNLATGVQSPTSSRSVAAASGAGDLTLSWDILDFGMNYYRAQQSSNNVLIAQEQRRSIVNQLMEDVRTAYWRAVSYERLNGRIIAVIAKSERALAQSRRLSNGGFDDRTTGLIFQRDLLRVMGEMQALQRDLSVAKPQLAALTNLQPGGHFHVRIPSRSTLPTIDQNVGDLVRLAYVNRPELRELTYEARNIDLESRASALELLPSIRPYLSASTDSNDLLANQQWVSAGTRVTWDLFNLLRRPRTLDLIQSRRDLNNARALALTYSVTTQVHVATSRYDILRRETRTAARYANVSGQITQVVQAQSASGLIGLQEEVLEEVGAILAELRFDARYAELQNAYGAVFTAVGINNYPGELTGAEPLDVLEDAIHDMWTARGEGLH
jgi:outer membrane protein TolC